MRFRYFITCLTFIQFATRFVSHIEVFLLHQVVGIFIKCSFHLLDFYFSLSICIFHNLASSFHSVIRVRSDAKCLPLSFFLSFFLLFLLFGGYFQSCHCSVYTFFTASARFLATFIFSFRGVHFSQAAVLVIPLVYV